MKIQENNRIPFFTKEKKSHSLLIWLYIIKAIVLIGFILWIMLFLNLRANKISQNDAIIEIEQGSSVGQVANNLVNLGVIESKWSFIYNVYISSSKLQFGTYKVDKKQPIKEIVNNMATGKRFEKKITIPEGWRLEQIAQKLSKENIIGYDDFMAVNKDKEGTFFPDTYFFIPKSDIETVNNIFLNNYKKKVNNISKEELIIASIVEREAIADSERAIIASIFFNRIKNKMPLQADPTVQYAVDTDIISKLNENQKINYEFWKPLVAAKIKTTDSPYNTYTNSNLPPGPIANPGLKSIKAALDPRETNYLYFVHDSEGETYFASTYDEHLANISKIK